MLFLFTLLVSVSSYAQSLILEGGDTRFQVRVQMKDPSGRGTFLPGVTEIDEFDFTYQPSNISHVARELFYADVFGREPFSLTLEDVEPQKFGRGFESPIEGVSGYYMRFELKPHARARIKGYRYIGLGLGTYGNVQPPHFVILMNDPEDNAEMRFSLAHRFYLGDSLFLEPIAVCEARLGGA